MIVIGENLNSSNKEVRNALDARDAEFVAGLAVAQEANGAEYLDINTAMCSNEAETLLWAAGVVTKSVKLPLMVDSPNANAICFLYESISILSFSFFNLSIHGIFSSIIRLSSYFTINTKSV